MEKQFRKTIGINGQVYAFANNIFYFGAKQYVLSKMTDIEIESLAHALLEVEGQTLLLEEEGEVATEASTTTEKA